MIIYFMKGWPWGDTIDNKFRAELIEKVLPSFYIRDDKVVLDEKLIQECKENIGTNWYGNDFSEKYDLIIKNP